MNNIISVDLGGTKVLTALLDEKNKIIDRVKIPTDITKGNAALVKAVAESIRKVLDKTKIKDDEVRAICMGVPGTVNPQSGMIGNAPNLNIKRYNIKNTLQKYFDIPVLIENDVNLAALGINEFEFKGKANNMLVVFVGTGIGGALLFNGKLYRGSSFFAGEIGHMRVNCNGEFTGRGKGKAFEEIASRTAIVNSIKKEIKDGRKSKLTDIAGKKRIKSKALAIAIEQKDKVVTDIILGACQTIGTVLGSLVTLLNVDTIVMGGGVIEAMDEFMLPKIKEAFEKAVLPEPGKKVKIVATKLGDDAPLYGGIPLANEILN